ncbi:MAG: hypothetical protein HKN26_06095 [Acidimicrobiales bacterium]|nr:hypothetical protein [Acidimicrobiales bacterium]
MILPTALHRFVLALLVVVALATACGSSGDDVSTPGDSDPTPTTVVDPGDTLPPPTPGGGPDVAAPGLVGPDWVVVDEAPGIVDASPIPVDSLTVDPDGVTVTAAFTIGVEPCTLRRVSARQTADAVEVLVESGIGKDAATITCPALAELVEVSFQLAEPIGNRELISVGGTTDNGPVRGPVDPDGMLDPAYVDSYIGLEYGAAEAKAKADGVEIRIAREDDDFFALTEDFRGNRVNVEIDDGIITALENW